MARILIIEDNPSSMELMRYLLGAFGHDTLGANNGSEGLELVAAQRPDLVICDIQLPPPDGIAIVRALKSDAGLAAIPVIAVTALAMVGDRRRILDAGFDGYMTKPIDPQRFVADVEAYLPTRVGPAQESDGAGAPAGTSARVRAILVVDDNATNRELMMATLRPFGFDVSGAESAAEALRMLSERRPCLVISDVHMPESDGFALLAAMKADAGLSGLPVMLLSSSAWGYEDRKRALGSGACCFLLRPVDPRQLLGEIEACLVAGD